MGTHCALVVKNQDGTIERFERTLEGYKLFDEMFKWSKDPDNQVPNIEDIGSGYLKYNEEGEYEHKCWAIIDYSTKQYMVSAMLSTQLIEMITNMSSKGWTLYEWGSLYDVLDDFDYYNR